MTVLISPTERWDHQTAFPGSVVSSVPEQYGSDILIVTTHGKLGIQQKTFPDDFFASMSDGRLHKELLQMKALDIAVLLLNGMPAYTSEGYLVDARYSSWTDIAVRNLQRSLSIIHQVYIEWAATGQQAVTIAREWVVYMNKTHQGFSARPKPETNSWGKTSSKDWGIHLLQSFPSVGPKRAAAIFEKFGKAPLKWECTVEELEEVEGVGSITAQKLMNALVMKEGGQTSA